jgi:hypothetical protein
MRWLGVGLLALAGCETTDRNLKPPLPEEYTIPPTDDARFSSPPNYPKDAFDRGGKKEPNKLDDRFRNSGGGFGSSGLRPY